MKLKAKTGKTQKQRSAEDDLIAAILQVKPTADMPKHPIGKAKAKPKKKSGK